APLLRQQGPQRVAQPDLLRPCPHRRPQQVLGNRVVPRHAQGPHQRQQTEHRLRGHVRRGRQLPQPAPVRPPTGIERHRHRPPRHGPPRARPPAPPPPPLPPAPPQGARGPAGPPPPAASSRARRPAPAPGPPAARTPPGAGSCGAARSSTRPAPPPPPPPPPP